MHAYAEALLKNILNLHFASSIVASERKYIYIIYYISLLYYIIKKVEQQTIDRKQCVNENTYLVRA